MSEGGRLLPGQLGLVLALDATVKKPEGHVVMDFVGPIKNLEIKLSGVVRLDGRGQPPTVRLWDGSVLASVCQEEVDFCQSFRAVEG